MRDPAGRAAADLLIRELGDARAARVMRALHEAGSGQAAAHIERQHARRRAFELIRRRRAAGDSRQQIVAAIQLACLGGRSTAHKLINEFDSSTQPPLPLDESS